MNPLDNPIQWEPYFNAVAHGSLMRLQGRIVKVIGLIAEAEGVGVSIGSRCKIESAHGLSIMAEVVGFKDERVLLMPYGDTRGIRPGSRVTLMDETPHADVGDDFEEE